MKSSLRVIIAWVSTIFALQPVWAQSDISPTPRWLSEIENVMKFVEAEDLSPKAIDKNFGTRFTGKPLKRGVDPLNMKFDVTLSDKKNDVKGAYLGHCPNISARRLPGSKYAQRFDHGRDNITFPLPSPSYGGAARLVSYGPQNQGPTFLVLPMNNESYYSSEKTVGGVEPSNVEVIHVAINSPFVDEWETLLFGRLKPVRRLAAAQYKGIVGLLLRFPKWKLVPNQTGLLALNSAVLAKLKEDDVDGLIYREISNSDYFDQNSRPYDQSSPESIKKRARKSLIEARFVNYDLSYRGKTGEWRISTEIVDDDLLRLTKYSKLCLERTIAFYGDPVKGPTPTGSADLLDSLIELLNTEKDAISFNDVAKKRGFEFLPSRPIDGAAGYLHYALKHPALAIRAGQTFGASQFVYKTPCLSIYDEKLAGTFWNRISLKDCDSEARLMFVAEPVINGDTKSCIQRGYFVNSLARRTTYRESIGGGFPQHHLNTALGSVLIHSPGSLISVRMEAVSESSRKSDLSKPVNPGSSQKEMFDHQLLPLPVGALTAWFDKECLVRFDFYSELRSKKKPQLP
jgi:hypothetical protein